jgi:hypothetical protein
MHSIQLLMALASAGTGFGAPEEEDDGVMKISDLSISTENAGACSAGAPHIPSPNAQIAVKFRVKNKDLTNYTVNVYLDVAGQLGSIFPLGSAPIYIIGYAPTNTTTDWTLNYLTNQDAKGVFVVRGYVEGGAHGIMTTQWTFRVELSDNATGVVLQRLTAPWSKTYGTCE